MTVAAPESASRRLAPTPRSSAAAAVFLVAAELHPQFFLQPSGLLKEVLLGRNDHALRRRHGVPDYVVTVGSAASSAAIVSAQWSAATEEEEETCWMGSTAQLALEDKVLEFGDEGLELVVDFVSAAVGGPVGGVPYGGVQGHRL
ncbi:hypothetical protein U1Q18_021571 [Sarracenia purpurea var. burkii]